MGTENIKLNETFKRDAREYQTRPVIAAKYRPGMENGFFIYFSNEGDEKRNPMQYEGVKVFLSEKEALNYIEADHKQCIYENGKLIEIEAMYDAPKPKLGKKSGSAGKCDGIDFGNKAFLSDESEKYDFFILEGDCWIIQELDGNIRVWYLGSSELSFGGDKEIVYEKIGKGNHCDYIQVAV